MIHVIEFGAFLRDAGGILLGTMLGYWILCIPFAIFTIDKIVKLIRKIY